MPPEFSVLQHKYSHYITDFNASESLHREQCVFNNLELLNAINRSRVRVSAGHYGVKTLGKFLTPMVSP